MAGRGVNSAILSVLNSVVIGTSGAFFYLYQIDLPSGTVYWDQRGNTAGGHTYTPRVLSSSDMPLRPTDTNEITLTLANADGAVTTLRQNQTFYGSAVRVYLWVPS